MKNRQENTQERMQENRKERVKKEKKDSKGKTRHLKVGMILAAFISSFVVYFAMIQTEKNVLTQYEKGLVCYAQKEIPRGTMITKENVDFYFGEREIDRNSIAQTMLRDKSQVEDMAAYYDIAEGTILMKGMFEPLQEILADIEQPVIVGVKADDIYQLVGGTLRAGDKIQLYTVTEQKEAELLWKTVFVESVFDQSGNRISNDNRTTPVHRLNLYLEQSQVAEFYAELAKGSLRAAKLWRS